MRRFRSIIIAIIILLIIINIAFIVILLRNSKNETKSDNKAISAQVSEKNGHESEAETGTPKNRDEADLGSMGDAEQGTKPEDTPEDFEFKMTFVGDCCMSTEKEKIVEGSLLWYADNYPTSYFFEKVISYFEDDDVTIANCENCFTDRDLPTKEKEGEDNYWFKSPTSFAKVFSDNSIEAVSIANNHSSDYGDASYEDTKKALDDAGVRWGDKDNTLYFEKNGYTVAVVCVSFFSYDSAEGVLDYLADASEKSDFQVIFFHGGIEGEFFPNSWVMEMCHKYVDNGADLIIGAHPHVLQRRETYNNVDIVYSLGNFCFGGNNNPSSNRTIIYKYNLKLHREPEGDKVELVDKSEEMIPCYVHTGGGQNNWQPAPIEDADMADWVIRYMNGEVEYPDPTYQPVTESDEENKTEE